MIREGTLFLSGKKVAYTILSLIMAGGLLYAYSINTGVPRRNLGAHTIGPEYFPNMLAAALVVLCVASIVRTYRSEDKTIEIPQFMMLLFTLGWTGAYLLAWQHFGQFFILAPAYLTVLFTVYRYERGRAAGIVATSLLAALLLTGIAYLVFVKVMSIHF